MCSNVCVNSINGGYVILFSRNGKKPHTIAKKTKADSYLSLIEGCQRAFKLAKDKEIVFRPSDERVLNVFNKDISELSESEKEMINIINSKDLTVWVKPSLVSYESIMNKELAKKINN